MKKLLALISVAALVTGVAMAANVLTRQEATHKMAPVSTVTAEMSKANLESRLAMRVDRPKTSIARALTDDIDTLYACPAGSFWVNRVMDAEGKIGAYYGMLIPDGEITWKNNTSGVDESGIFTWYYVDATTDGKYASVDSYDLVNTIKGDIRYVYPAPVLTVGGAEDGYQAQDGKNRIHWAGNIAYKLDDAGNTSSMSNFDIIGYNDNSSLGRAYPSAKENQENGWTGNEFWMDEFADPTSGIGIEADTCIVRGVAEHIPYSGRPYTISKVNILASIIADEGAVLKCSLIPVGENGADFDNPLATTEYTFGTEAVDFANLQMDLQFKNIDPETGYEVDDPLVIDQDVLIYFDFNDALISYFAPYYNGVNRAFAQVHTWDNVRQTAYAVVEYGAKNGEEYTPEGLYLGEAGGGYVWGSSSTGVYYLPTTFVVGFDLAYPYLYTDDEVELEVAAEGESKEMTVHSSEVSESFLIAGDEKGETDMPDWLSIEFVDGEYSGTTSAGEAYTEYDGTVATTITAEALPEGMTGRQAEIYLIVPTQVIKITVKQGEVQVGVKGDVNGDGILSGADVTALYGYLLDNKEVAGNPDVNGDGSVSGADVTALYNLLLN